MKRTTTPRWPALVIAITLGGCWHEETNHDLTRPENPLGVTGAGNAPVFAARYLVVASDGEGNLNIFGDDGAGATHNYGAIAIRQAQGSALPLGDVLIHQGRAVVLISTGLKDDSGADTGGGVAIVDLAKAVANIDDATAVEIVPLVSGLTAKRTRITRASVEPDGKYVWLSNAGPEGDSGSDSMFRLNWNPGDTTDTDGAGNMDDVYKNVVEVLVGHGDKFGSHSHGPAGFINAPVQLVACNLEDRTLSVVNNDHMSGASFLTMTKTIPLGPTDSCGGIGYSKFSGKFYVGLSAESANAVTIVTATPVNNAYTVANIAAGTAANQIPAGGAVHVSDNGEYVYALGYDTVAARGYLSIVETSLKTNDDAVVEVVDLGDVAAARMTIAEVPHNSMTHWRLLMPATARGGVNDTLLWLDVSPTTGKTMMMNNTPTPIPVGAGQAQRDITVTKDHLRAYVPNGGDCGSAGPDCKTIAVLDVVAPAKVTTLTTRGTQPRSVAVIDFAELGVAPPPDTGGGGGHQH